jgi:hypothetical protein
MERKRIKYNVCRKGDKWVIMFSGRPFGGYPDMESALREAQGSAEFLITQGHDVEVNVEQE